MLVFRPFKVIIYSFIQFIKGNTKGVVFEISIIMVKGQAVQYGKIGLAEFLFRNISLLAKVCKNSQFKIKIVVFTAVFRFVSIELGQVSQLLAVGLYLGGLQICDLSNGRVLVDILVYKGIAVCNLKIGYILACKIGSKTTLVY